VSSFLVSILSNRLVVLCVEVFLFYVSVPDATKIVNPGFPGCVPMFCFERPPILSFGALNATPLGHHHVGSFFFLLSPLSTLGSKITSISLF